jgi:hypothetical protein
MKILAETERNGGKGEIPRTPPLIKRGRFPLKWIVNPFLWEKEGEDGFGERGERGKISFVDNLMRTEYA